MLVVKDQIISENNLRSVVDVYAFLQWAGSTEKRVIQCFIFDRENKKCMESYWTVCSFTFYIGIFYMGHNFSHVTIQNVTEHIDCMSAYIRIVS